MGRIESRVVESSLYGGPFLTEGDATIENNVTNQNLGVTLSASHRATIFEFDLQRETDTASSQVRSNGRIIFSLKDGSWEISGYDYSGDDDGVSFSITAAGVIKYTSSNISGANYVGDMKYFRRDFNV